MSDNQSVLDELKLTVSSFAELDHGWNGYSANAISQQTVDQAVLVLDLCLNIANTVCVFPTGRDSIQLERTREKEYLELEIYADRIVMYKSGSTQVELTTTDVAVASTFFNG